MAKPFVFCAEAEASIALFTRKTPECRTATLQTDGITQSSLQIFVILQRSQFMLRVILIAIPVNEFCVIVVIQR
jgi:hypothetical protein